MATAFVRVDGTFVCWNVLSPHAETVPSLRKASV